MRPATSILTATLLVLTAPALAGKETGEVYKWKDEDGTWHYGDSVPPQYAEQDKHVLNKRGIHKGIIEGKKTAEELEAERLAAEAERQEELRRRDDMALLATYLNVQEIEMHRDRRIELYEAQSRVTELYLNNLKVRLRKLEQEASHYMPYSPDPEAPQIGSELVEEIDETQATIARHQQNLAKFGRDVEEIRRRFQNDIRRFRELKGVMADSQGP